MDFISSINMITILILGIFFIPIITGVIRPFSHERVQYTLISMLRNLELLMAVILSVYLTGVLFSENSILADLFINNTAIWNSIVSQDIWAFIIVFLIILLILKGIFRLVFIPLYRKVIIKISVKLSSDVDNMHIVVKRIIGGLWQLPKSALLVLIFSLLLNFYSSFASNTALVEYINTSLAYSSINKNVLDPMLNTGFAKQIPVFLTTTFEKAVINLSPDGRKNLIYYNGMTLEDAVASTYEIDEMALDIVGIASDDKEKAYLLYMWISENIVYDYEKADAISYDPTGISSGARDAFETRTGVCFDISCLYIAMCRAVGLSVRFVTGLGYSGEYWGDHSWNQVYYPKDDRWINVDATFGISGIDYFDNQDFHIDHMNDEFQGEW